jgi:hypothetical protein
VPYSTRGYSFQSWFLCELLKNGARYVEIPLPFPTRLYGHSKLTFRDKVEFLVCLFHLPKWKPGPAQELERIRESSPAVSVAEHLPTEVGSHAQK